MDGYDHHHHSHHENKGSLASPEKTQWLYLDFSDSLLFIRARLARFGTRSLTYLR